MTAKIGSAGPDDLAAVLDLVRRSKLPPDGLEQHIDTTLAARVDGKLVGCATLELYGQAALLRSLAVDARHRGEGLGQRLTRAALELARRRGATTVYLLTETAIDFFPKFGFQVVARDAVDPEVRRSVEFTTACPASAVAMRMELTAPA